MLLLTRHVVVCAGNTVGRAVSWVVVQLLSCVWLCNPVDCSMPGFLVLHHLPEFAETRVHWVSDAINLLSSVVPFPCLQSFPASGSLSNVSSSHQVAKVLEFQLQHQSFQWIFKTDFLEDWWLYLLAVQGTLHYHSSRSLLHYHSSKTSILQRSVFFIV